RGARFGAQGPGDDSQSLVEVTVSGSSPTLCEAAESGGRVPTGKALLGVRFGLGIQEQPPILGGEEKEEPVDEAEQFPVVVLRRECPGGEGSPEQAVVSVGQEASTEGDD